MRLTEKEYGFIHKFIFRSDIDLVWVTETNLIIKKNGVDSLNITTNLTVILPNIIEWNVQNGQTNFTGNYDGILVLTSGGRREEVFFDVFLESSKV